ncbi:MAG: MATE family efflux transporter [Candidatus Aminicenantia bacterium]
MNQDRIDLTSGSIPKTIWILAWPMMMGNVLQTTFNVVDMIFVGKLGPEAIAAVAMSGIILMLVITLIIGVATGTTAMVARFVGAKDYLEANNVAMQSLIIGTLGSTILAAFGILFSRPLLRIFGADTIVADLGTDYLQIMFVGSITMFILFLVGAILRGAGDALTPMLVLIFSTILNIIADPLLIFGIGIFPRLEIRGAAIATVFARGIGMIIGLIILFRGYSYIHIKPKRFHVNFDIIKRIIKIAIPGSLEMSIRSVSGLILMSIVAFYGTYALAAYGIGLRINMVAMMPGFGLAAATATLVGQNLGAKQPKRAEKSARIAAGFYEIIMITIGFLFFIFAREIIHFFNTNPEVIRLGASFIRIISLSYVFLAMSIIFNRGLTGAGDTLSPMIITGVSVLGLRIPLALILPKVTSLSITGIWLAIALSTVLEGTIIALWFNLGKWKHKKV